MAEIINQIPGYEKGRVQRINATDEVSESFIVAQMAADLRKKWNTSVLCISLDGHKEAIELEMQTLGINHNDVSDLLAPPVFVNAEPKQHK